MYFLNIGEREKIKVATSTGVVTPKRINQKRFFSSGNKSASRNAKTPKKKMARMIENLNGLSERLK
jgi:hypothetical protein